MILTFAPARTDRRTAPKRGLKEYDSPTAEKQLTGQFYGRKTCTLDTDIPTSICPVSAVTAAQTFFWGGFRSVVELSKLLYLYFWAHFLCPRGLSN